ncbi:MAG: hypothetical protein Ct9H300mP18_11880 [Candidatus Neomarinimicrobiota bacterium]|nr:MAG: hypothetical protein Ct9H300mP18_11880 [Candidatus Neomarinimicrobiota bacterium]
MIQLYLALEEGNERKKRGEKQINKSITAELGCVTPIIVVPGPGQKQILNIKLKILRPKNFIMQVLIVLQVKCWFYLKAGIYPKFTNRSKINNSSTQLREPYYPGAKDRHEAIKQSYGNCEIIDENGKLSRLLITDLDHTAIMNIYLIMRYL